MKQSSAKMGSTYHFLLWCSLTSAGCCRISRCLTLATHKLDPHYYFAFSYFFWIFTWNATYWYWFSKRLHGIVLHFYQRHLWNLTPKLLQYCLLYFEDLNIFLWYHPISFQYPCFYYSPAIFGRWCTLDPFFPPEVIRIFVWGSC